MTFKKKIITLFILLILFVFSFPVGYYVLQNGSTPINTAKTAIQPNSVVSYVINLDRSPERLEYVMPNILGLGFPFERISGVDGKKLSEAEINQNVNFPVYKKYLNHYPLLGTIGCSLSHIKAWQTFLASPYEYALIFEDDVKFDPTTVKPIVESLLQSKSYWDISTLEIAHGGTPLTVKNLTDPYKLVVYLTEVSHTGAYIINRNAAQKLVEKALPITMPVDHYFTRTWEMGLKFTGVEPRLVHQKFGDSIINQTEASGHSTLYDTVTSGVYKTVFKIQSYAIRFAYNLKVYFELKYNV